MRGLRIVSALLCLWAALAPARALADRETEAFHAAMAGAYRHYREAVHYWDNDNAELAALALDEFHAAWRPIIARYGDAPPPAYRKAPPEKFRQSLLEVSKLAGQAQAARDRPTERSASLQAIPLVLRVLRQANNVRLYSDCIESMNEAMARLWEFRRRPPAPGDAAAVRQYRSRLEETTLRYRQCRDEAPASYRASEDFKRLFDGALAALAKLAAVDLAHSDAVVSILRELHSFDRLIWLKFG